jgi:hypothetical protein
LTNQLEQRDIVIVALCTLHKLFHRLFNTRTSPKITPVEAHDKKETKEHSNNVAHKQLGFE